MCLGGELEPFTLLNQGNPIIYLSVYVYNYEKSFSLLIQDLFTTDGDYYSTPPSNITEIWKAQFQLIFTTQFLHLRLLNQ